MPINKCILKYLKGVEQVVPVDSYKIYTFLERDVFSPLDYIYLYRPLGFPNVSPYPLLKAFFGYRSATLSPVPLDSPIILGKPERESITVANSIFGGGRFKLRQQCYGLTWCVFTTPESL